MGHGDKPDTGIDRRAFLKGAAAAGATVAGGLGTGVAQQRESTVAAGGEDKVAASTPAKMPLGDRVIGRPGSDFMVDVLKTLDLEYVACNPGSSFRSLHESVVNYGGNTKPELLTCMHEESSVAIAHGYAKAAGKPMGGTRMARLVPVARC